MSPTVQPLAETMSPAHDGAPVLRLRLFGMMEASGPNAVSVLPRSRKTKALLAILALAAPRLVLRARLTGLLWSTRRNEQARASLRQALHELQEALGAISSTSLWTDRNQLGLREELLWVDVHEVSRATASTRDVLDLGRGELLEDLDGIDPVFNRWLAAERNRLRGLWRDLGERLLALQHEPDAIVAAANRLLTIDPGHEGAWRGMITAHLDRGDRGAAISAFDKCKAALSAIGGLAPPDDLVALIAGIRRLTGKPADVAAVQHSDPMAYGRREGGVRLGVMPMRLLSGEGEDPLSLGLAEEITTALSRVRWISCVASTSLAAVAGIPHDVKLWERLDLDFMLDGTVQRSGGRVRITARLLDMRENGAVVWARRFDRHMTDILSLQEDIAAQTVAQLDPELLLFEAERAADRPPPPDPTAYELMLRAIPSIYRVDQTGFLAAGDLLRAAVAIDPHHAAAHAWLAYWHLFLVGQGWAEDPTDAATQGGILADRAVMLDPNDARGLTLSGHVRAFLGKRSEEGVALHQRALSLNPNLPMAWAYCGLAQSYLGRHDEAIECIGQAHRLSPFDPHGFIFDSALIVPHMLKHDHDTALRIGRRAIELNPGFSASYKGVLALLGHLDRPDEAAVMLSRLMALEPRLTLEDALSRSPFLQPEDRAHYAEGLRLAGLR